MAEKPDFIDELYTMDQLDEVLPKVDFAVFILPSTPATHHIMDEPMCIRDRSFMEALYR